MSSTGGRMLELLALLQVRHRWSGRDLAERLDVSPRTLRRDIDRLRDLGYPVKADRGLDGGYRLGTGSRLPPLLVNDDEAVAIAIGLRTAADQPISGIGDASMSALIKVGQSLPAPLQRRVESISGTRETAPTQVADSVAMATLTTLARASRDRELVRFAYEGTRGDASQRHVEPHHVVPFERRWYLIAWDLERHDWRTFRLDRIVDPRSTNRRFSSRSLPAPDPAAYLRDTIATLKAVYDVEMTVEAPLESVRPHLGPWASATQVSADITCIRMHIPDLGWAVLMLAVLNVEIRHAEPAELRDLLRDLAARFESVAGDPGENA